ncbi:long-chain-fatty-acid--CoA ligase [Cryobacterium suzukii]|uniref:long-chain-fatty-acid--CoA ligase n=1 Tax=Cryobacterium suzukii TaxID=1259198 RepID=UPI00141BDB41|nr:long-chain-fatty-acid--CoA ligase [Cryobacterium suzukii]
MNSTLSSLLSSLAREHGGAPALTLGERTITFSELDSTASLVADALTAAQIQPGDRVAILDKNSIEYFEVLFGAGRAGAVVVGVNYRLCAQEIRTLILDSRPRVLFVSPDLEHLSAELGADLLEGLTIVRLGPDFEIWCQAAAQTAGAWRPDATVAEDDVVLQMYSSGTTGLPKGVMLTHRNLSFTPRMGREFYGMHQETVNLLTSPLFHIGGAGYALTTLGQGGHTILVRDFVASAVLEDIQRHRVTNMFLVPATIDMLIAESKNREYDLSSIALIAYGGAPITIQQLLAAFAAFDCDFMAVYGMTEAAGTVTCLPPSDHELNGERSHLLGSIGKSLPWHEIRIIDPATGLEARSGLVGEVCIRSEQNMAGYWNQPEMTKEALDADGWLHTGDAGYCDGEGYIFLKDRIKDMIISGGENIYSIEVENVLMQHPDVREVAVIGIPHEKWGETVRAMVVPVAGRVVTEVEIVEFCRSSLARYKCPTTVQFIDALPRNASGKLLKRVLRENALEPENPQIVPNLASSSSAVRS